MVALARAGRTLERLARDYEPCAPRIANSGNQADLDERVEF